MSSKVLILDDDADFNSLLTDVFEQADYDVTSIEDPLQALDIFAEGRFDLVVTDHKMPEMTGTEFMKRVKKMSPETPVIMVSGYLENDAIRDLISDGVGGVFLKPLNIFSLLERTNELLEESKKIEAKGSRATGESENSASSDPENGLDFRFRSFPCRSEKSRHFAERLYNQRNFKSTLTLTGEVGMHFQQICEDIAGFYPRNYEYFLYFDKENFDEATVLGSLQKAIEDGYDRVTCIIEHAEALNDSQKALVAALAKNEGAFEGATIGIRIIFCLCEDIDSLFDKELIDENLYILMGTAEITVPALRDCAKDIPIMAQKLAVDSFREFGKDSVPRFDAASKEYLQSQPWPQNYQELRMAVRSAMEGMSGDVISVEALLADGTTSGINEAERFKVELSRCGDELIFAVWMLMDKDSSSVAIFFGTSTEVIEQRLNLVTQ